VGVFRSLAATGTRVRQGDRVAVVDLLGIPQDVVAPIDGIVVELLVEPGDAVEYGEEVVMIAEPVADRGAVDGADPTDGAGGGI
jgi:biotin carboxyl carrier protein